jgi:hypothetical protein
MAIKPEVIKPFDRVSESLTSNSPLAVRQRIEALEHVLEGLITIPGTNQKVGLDVILSLIPVGGSAIAAILGSYLAWEARNLGMPKSTFLRMGANIGFDALIGAIPLIGAVPDLFFRSNTRNMKIIKRYLDKHHPSTKIIDQ